jgi:hypothetical protein
MNAWMTVTDHVNLVAQLLDVNDKFLNLGEEVAAFRGMLGHGQPAVPEDLVESHDKLADAVAALAARFEQMPVWRLITDDTGKPLA